jgi:DNA polymerase I-like protein with 3'-5' exonuclease and polymerase domains
MVLARISMYNRMKKRGLKSILVSTVHDSIVADCPDEEVDEVCKMFHQVTHDIPANFERIFGKKFNLPMKAEVLFGHNLNQMEEYKI